MEYLYLSDDFLQKDCVFRQKTKIKRVLSRSQNQIRQILRLPVRHSHLPV
jgi:hypothetical protein